MASSPSALTRPATDPDALRLKVHGDEGSRQFTIQNDHMRLEDFDAEYVSIGGFFGTHSPHVFAAAAALYEALHGLTDILNRAESNASGNPEWEAVSKRINAARAALKLAEA